MNPLTAGIYQATHKPTGDVFMLSVVKCRLGLVLGVAAYPVGGNRPSRKAHALPNGLIALWLADLDITEGGCEIENCAQCARNAEIGKASK